MDAPVTEGIDAALIAQIDSVTLPLCELTNERCENEATHRLGCLRCPAATLLCCTHAALVQRAAMMGRSIVCGACGSVSRVLTELPNHPEDP